MPGAESCAVDTAGAPSVAELLTANARLESELDGLHRALRSRAAIEQAKGVLMVLSRCSEAAAFGWLSRLSQQRNVRVQALAELLLGLAASGFEVRPDEPGLATWLRGEVLPTGDLSRPARGPARPGGHPARPSGSPGHRPAGQPPAPPGERRRVSAPRPRPPLS